jgi:hypothetical protein
MDRCTAMPPGSSSIPLLVAILLVHAITHHSIGWTLHPIDLALLVREMREDAGLA